MNTPSPATHMVSVRYCGRDFTPEDLDGIRAIIASPERPHRTAMAQAVCRLFNWVKPDGGLKVVSCSVALKRMQADGLIERLPPKAPPLTAASDPQPLMEGVRRDLGPLELRRVTQPAQSRLWREWIVRYHYAGFCRLVGAQMRYLVYADGRLLAALGFGAAARRLRPRCLHRLERRPTRGPAAFGRQPGPVSHLSLGADQVSRLQHPLPSRSPTPTGLGGSLRLPGGAPGNLRGVQPLRRHQLPRRQLELCRRNGGTR